MSKKRIIITTLIVFIIGNFFARVDFTYYTKLQAISFFVGQVVFALLIALLIEFPRYLVKKRNKNKLAEVDTAKK